MITDNNVKFIKIYDQYLRKYMYTQDGEGEGQEEFGVG